MHFFGLALSECLLSTFTPLCIRQRPETSNSGQNGLKLDSVTFKAKEYFCCKLSVGFLLHLKVLGHLTNMCLGLWTFAGGCSGLPCPMGCYSRGCPAGHLEMLLFQLE